jgi:LuxR family maltose regulon positive regulatory protein
MRVRVLGEVTLTAAGESIPFPGGKIGDLLRLLLVAPGEIVSAEDLCDRLWPGSAADVARPRLHVTASRLRGFLHRDEDDDATLHIEQDAGGYRLHATAESLDSVHFEALAARALTDEAIDAEAVDEALALWGGEPFGDLDSTAEVRNRRNHLATLHRNLVAAAALVGAEPDEPGSGFLRAKFRAPGLQRASWLPRTRLLDATPGVGDVTVLAVTAPAGFGKSVFLSQWTQRQGIPVVWVSLEPADNDPSRFWSGVVGAIVETGWPDLDTSTRELRAGSSAFIDAVSEAVAAAPSPLALVLDDFHVITNPAVHRQVATFVSALPASGTIAVASRVDLPLPTSGLGMSGRLREVTAAQLCFSANEIEALVHDPARSERLWHLTEGWPVAVVALRDVDGPATATEPDDMVRYLVEEVLAAVPPDMERFLLEVSVLDRFNRQLCEAVTRRDDVAEKLHWLQANQLFLLDFGSAGDLVRLHHLIAAELRRRAEADGVVDPALLRRAADWFVAQGMPEQALRYAIEAKDRALVIATAPEVLVMSAIRQETRACLTWLEQLDPDDVAADARTHSIATCLAAIWAPIELRLRWAHSRSRSFGGPDDVVLQFHDGVVAMREGRTTEATRLFEQVIDGASEYAANTAPDLAGVLVGMAHANLVEARMFQDTLQPDDSLFSETMGLTRPSAPGVATFSLSFWALIAFLDGSYYLASSLAEEHYQGRRREDVIRQATRENTLVGALATAQRAEGPAHLRTLAQGIEDVVDVYERLGAHTWIALTRMIMASLYRAGGDLGAANAHQRRADIVLRTLPDAPFLVRFASSVDDIVAGRTPGEQGLVGLLTARERVILAYLTTELTVEQIASALYVSRGTVSAQVSSIYRKLGVNSRHRALLKVGPENIDLSVVAEDASVD